MHEIPIEDSIDLHTFQPREVKAVVEEYLFQAVQRGFSEVRIIHGRGVGVQREIVHGILRSHPNVTAFRDAADNGSTYVRLSPRDRVTRAKREPDRAKPKERPGEG